MFLEKIIMNGYAAYVWPAFIFSFTVCYFLYMKTKKEFIKQSRKIKFITDKYGFRNDRYEIDNAEIILIGDSFIIGTGTTQAKIPANQLSDISSLNVASLAYVGNPNNYELLAKKYINNFVVNMNEGIEYYNKMFNKLKYKSSKLPQLNHPE